MRLWAWAYISVDKIVFTKEHQNKHEEQHGQTHQVVVRVSDAVRKVIKGKNDKLFLDFNALHVNDRFYVKRCIRCHKFGHYQTDCHANKPSCGFCCSEEHLSENCPFHQAKDQGNYQCINCKEQGNEHEGHSSHWPKCPTYIELQNKLMKNIPYYTKNRQ